jgi:hypothetical protein
MAAVTRASLSGSFDLTCTQVTGAPRTRDRQRAGTLTRSEEFVMHWFVAQVIWFGLAASTIYVDRKLLSSPIDMSDPEHVDLKDRSASPFLLLMLVLGGFVIPFYLWYSRRSAAAVLAGIGIMVGCTVFVGFVSAVLR